MLDSKTIYIDQELQLKILNNFISININVLLDEYLNNLNQCNYEIIFEYLDNLVELKKLDDKFSIKDKIFKMNVKKIEKLKKAFSKQKNIKSLCERLNFLLFLIVSKESQDTLFLNLLDYFNELKTETIEKNNNFININNLYENTKDKIKLLMPNNNLNNHFNYYYA
ncbi:hypothetical protein [Spiroplasma attinicola]|uniref:hypothetical protein n=1 Tax=Spiroplasma attinicola TaxID=2904537 RepID=UPI002022AA12|nr:hypothetical protein [Spiroplasma sp. JKS002670]MCL8209967.1 hypothetical protein [Spiroplasma sp. JKS002670]